MCLVCDYRVMSEAATVGLPEVKLGIIPGFGGTVRLSRVIGIDNAIEWIATSANKKPAAALKDGAVDAVVAAAQLQNAAIDLVKQAIEGRLDWKAKRQEKLDPVKLDVLEQMMAFNSSRGVVLAKANPAQYPAPKLISLITLQGLPTATTLSGISLVTILPAPITTFSPIVTPGTITTPAPIQALFPM